MSSCINKCPKVFGKRPHRESCHPSLRRMHFVRCMRCAGTFARGGRNAFKHRYVIRTPLKSSHSRTGSGPDLIRGSLENLWHRARKPNAIVAVGKGMQAVQ